MPPLHAYIIYYIYILHEHWLAASGVVGRPKSQIKNLEKNFRYVSHVLRRSRKGLILLKKKKEKPRESKRKQFLNCNIRPPFVGAIFEKQMLICLPASGMRSLAGWLAKLIHKVTQKGIFLLLFSS